MNPGAGAVIAILFSLLGLTLLGFHGGLPDHLAIPDAAY
jgi:hypothetical protein